MSTDEGYKEYDKIFKQIVTKECWGIGNMDIRKPKATTIKKFCVFQSTTDEFEDTTEDYEYFPILEVDSIDDKQVVVCIYFYF